MKKINGQRSKKRISINKMPKEKTHEEDMGYDQLTPALLPEIEQLVKVTLLLPWFTYATPPHCKKK